ncbi:MAG: methylmalonyl Co-A mutase-associated GTPase MeaB, partial [Rhizobiaceae bacterium]
MTYIASNALLERVRRGEVAATARLISRAEAGISEARPAIGVLYREAGRAHVIGITGVPGSGKSTLVGVFARKLRARGGKVAIVAIDPSSPYSGGSILGDRIRMADLALDDGVFIRSMATSGAIGGMAHAALDVVDILDVAGYDWIIVETVGVGQMEVEIASAADTTVVVVTPGWGDSMQANKAGLLEIADVFVINKADRPGVREARRDLEQMLDLSRPDAWRPEIVDTTATAAEGVAELWSAIRAHRAHLEASGGLEDRRAARVGDELSRIMAALLHERAV